MVAVMDHEAKGSEERFRAYGEALAEVIGHADREQPLRDYCLGLLMSGERKSVEPMAALVAPARVSAEHQSLLHFVGQAPWSDEAVLRRVRDLVPHRELAGRSRRHRQATLAHRAGLRGPKGELGLGHY